MIEHNYDNNSDDHKKSNIIIYFFICSIMVTEGNITFLLTLKKFIQIRDECHKLSVFKENIVTFF